MLGYHVPVGYDYIAAYDNVGKYKKQRQARAGTDFQYPVVCNTMFFRLEENGGEVLQKQYKYAPACLGLTEVGRCKLDPGLKALGFNARFNLMKIHMLST